MENNFINSKQNDYFSSLRGLDLQELLVQVQNYFLEYRDKLNLSNDTTIGVEIEYEGVSKKNVDNYVQNNLTGWNSKRDGSLSYGGEITSPIMKDKIKYWQELKKICDYLSKKNADTLHNAGGHIHIGANLLGDDVDAWRQFAKLYIAYENILFRFYYGDKMSGRKKIIKYAKPTADILYYRLDQINEARYMYQMGWALRNHDRYLAINFENVDFNEPNYTYGKNTIEFRGPNASTDAVIIQNNINAFAKMLISSKSKIMDEDFLDYKLDKEFVPYENNEYLYNEVNLKNALEFVDLVFDNNKDKIYFLRQYIKNFEENYGIKTAVMAKKFVK